MPLPENDDMFNTKGKMLQDITTLLGGRVAEEIIFGDITTGASNDIKRATSTARAMAVSYTHLYDVCAGKPVYCKWGISYDSFCRRCQLSDVIPVSYTHLDVYKRQGVRILCVNHGTGL